MAIKGLTDNVLPAFPRLGKLRKGGEKQNNQYGKDLTYFRFTSERKDVEAAFAASYGTQPALLHVYLPYPDIARDFATWKEAWGAGGLQHRCDGETMVMWLGQDGKYHREPQPCNGGCKAVGRLTVIVPELWQAGFIGYVTMETHSLNDLLGIQAVLQAVLDARRDNPAGLCGIEFTLRRAPETISTPGSDGKRARRQKWLVKLEPAVDWAVLQLEAAKAQTMSGDVEDLSKRKLLTAARDAAIVPTANGRAVDPDTGEVIEPSDEGDEGDEYEELDDEPEPFTDELKPDPPAQKKQPAPQAQPEPQKQATPTATGWAAWAEKSRTGFWAKCNSLSLSKELVHREFGVKSMTEYTGKQPHAATVLKLLEYGVQNGLTVAQIDAALRVERADLWASDLDIGKQWIDAWMGEQAAQAKATQPAPGAPVVEAAPIPF